MWWCGTIGVHMTRGDLGVQRSSTAMRACVFMGRCALRASGAAVSAEFYHHLCILLVPLAPRQSDYRRRECDVGDAVAS